MFAWIDCVCCVYLRTGFRSEAPPTRKLSVDPLGRYMRADNVRSVYMHIYKMLVRSMKRDYSLPCADKILGWHRVTVLPLQSSVGF